MTPKQTIKIVDPKATLDYYELLRGQGLPCWFIRHGLQGPHLSFVASSPRAAWKNALDLQSKMMGESVAA
jgi:hypothetical protein